MRKASQSSTSSDKNANKNATTSSLLTGLLSLPLSPMAPTATPSATTSPPVESHEGAAEPEPMETGDEKEGNSTDNNQSSEVVERPIQKNKKKCWTCRVKLELAQRELGHCKCGRFIQLYLFLYPINI